MSTAPRSSTTGRAPNAGGRSDTRVSSIPALLLGDGVRVIGQATDAPGGFGEYFLLSEAMTQVVRADLPDELVVDRRRDLRRLVLRQPGRGGHERGARSSSAAARSGSRRSRRSSGSASVRSSRSTSSASRRETALAMGADVVVDPAELSPYEAWRDVAFGSPGADPGHHGAARSAAVRRVRVRRHPGVLDAIIKGCERSTRIFSAGGPPDGDHLHTMVAKRKGLNIQFGGGPSITHWNEAFEEVCSGRLDVTPMIGTSRRARRGARRDRRRPGTPTGPHASSWCRADEPAMRVGIVGTGEMGRPLVDRLLAPATTSLRTPADPRLVTSSPRPGSTSSIDRRGVGAGPRRRDPLRLHRRAGPASRARRRARRRHGAGSLLVIHTTGSPDTATRSPTARAVAGSASSTRRERRPRAGRRRHAHPLRRWRGGRRRALPAVVRRLRQRSRCTSGPRLGPDGEARQQPPVRRPRRARPRGRAAAAVRSASTRAELAPHAAHLQRRELRPRPAAPMGSAENLVAAAGRFVHKDVVVARRRRRPTSGSPSGTSGRDDQLLDRTAHDRRRTAHERDRRPTRHRRRAGGPGSDCSRTTSRSPSSSPSTGRTSTAARPRPPPRCGPTTAPSTPSARSRCTAMTRSPAWCKGEGHQGLILNGCGHVLTVPHVVVDGDRAYGRSYALNIRWDADEERFWVARVSANTWEWVRTPDGWRIAERINANLDGTPEHRRMLAPGRRRRRPRDGQRRTPVRGPAAGRRRSTPRPSPPRSSCSSRRATRRRPCRRSPRARACTRPRSTAAGGRGPS